MIIYIFKLIVLIFIIIIASNLFFWLVILKIIAKFVNIPCPAGAQFIVNNPVRKKYMKPVLDRVGIQPGEKILELGPGPGLFTIDAAKQLEPGDTLIAVDIQKEMINKLEEKLQENKIDNVETIIASAHDLPIPDNSIDRVFLVTVLPEIPDKGKALREL